ncbi:hypothetical protein M434DRAFT_91214 [Hypoxylon sp. CO27-5]|nr:hypothetical protein M434DRAFT_91214 [Hypoxylon sp. CO27-5]
MGTGVHMDVFHLSSVLALTPFPSYIPYFNLTCTCTSTMRAFSIPVAQFASGTCM